jgi:hypothetical protein
MDQQDVVHRDPGLRQRVAELVREALAEDANPEEIEVTKISRQFGRRIYAVSVPGRSPEWILKTTFRYREAIPHLVVPYAVPEVAAATCAYREFPELGEYWVLMERLEGPCAGGGIAGLEAVARALARMHRTFEGFWHMQAPELEAMTGIDQAQAELVHSAVHATHPFNEATSDEWTGKLLVTAEDVERCVWSNMVWVEAAAVNNAFHTVDDALVRACAQAAERFLAQADGLTSQPDTLLHGDPQGDNWIIKHDGSVVTFDYLLSVGPGALDVSSLILPTWWTSISEGTVRVSHSPVEGVLKKTYWEERRSLDAAYPGWDDFEAVQTLADILALFVRAGMYCRRVLLQLNYGRFDPYSSILEWMGKASACGRALAAFGDALPSPAAVALG